MCRLVYYDARENAHHECHRGQRVLLEKGEEHRAYSIRARRRDESRRKAPLKKAALVALRGRHRDVVAGVGGEFGQLRFQDLGRVRYLSQLGDTSGYGRLGTHFAFHVPH